MRPLDGTQPLTAEGDLSAQMVQGIDRWLTRETARVAEQRAGRWSIPQNDPAARERFFAEKRDALRKMLGVVDERRSGVFEIVTTPVAARPAEANAAITVERVRWPVFDDVNGEGLLLRPPARPVAAVVAIPDADARPELMNFTAALRLAQSGCVVLVPVLVNRDERWSGSERLNRHTQQPHREWIYRQAFEMGRTLIGYEVQKVQSGLDALHALAPEAPLGVFGYGEGGLLALYTAALDTRIAATVVSGYFGPREGLWEEPIYRNVFGLLRDFGDAELAALIAPRRLHVEACEAPRVAARAGATPGRIATPTGDTVKAEVARANRLIGNMTVVAHFPKADQQPGEATLNVFVPDLGAAPIAAKPVLEIRATFEAEDALQRRG